jgi:O-antigen ligase
LALLAYVSIGAGGTAGAWILISVAFLVVGLIRARTDPEQTAIAGKILSRATTLLPGALVVYFSFNDGGFFPGPPALVAVLLALLLAGRLLLGIDGGPARGSGGRLRTALVVLFAAYAAWVLASGLWSGSWERAFIALDYVLVYGLGFALFAVSVRGSADVRWVMRGLALGAVAVCGFAFLSRVLPSVWSAPLSQDTPRLSYPLTYWNALGLLAALGIILCVGLTCDDREPRVVKALSAMALPMLGVTLLLTFSRGPIFAGGVGLIAYVLLARPRPLLSAAVVVGPAATIAVIIAYRATSLAQILNGSSMQASQGHHVAVVVGLSSLAAGVGRLATAGTDPYLLRLGQNRRPVTPSVARAAWAATGCLAVVASLALGLPSMVTTEYHRFIQGDVLPSQPKLRDRLTSIGADGRVTLWKVSIRDFEAAPLAGTGAGTYALEYAAHRQYASQVINAHSLYFENLGELGVIGVGLLGCLVIGSLLAVGQRTRKPERTLYAAALAAALVWTIHAGFDWDWQMPAVSIPAIVLAGASLGRPRSARTPGRRPVFAIIVLILAIVPALVAVSEHHLDAGLAGVARNDCATATLEAKSSLTPIGFRSSPHEILAYCHAARGERAAALAEIAAAVKDDPQNWEPRYGLSIVLAIAGRDPRSALLAASARNHLEPVIATLRAEFRREPRSRWATDAEVAPLPVGGQYGTAVAVLRADASRQ